LTPESLLGALLRPLLDALAAWGRPRRERRANLDKLKREILSVGVKHLYPERLQKLRELIVANGLDSAPGFSDFYDRWLTDPVVEIGEPVSGWHSDEKIAQMRQEISAL